jgi:predicted ATP-grasp superfamily ATP-dependent carboligase
MAAEVWMSPDGSEIRVRWGDGVILAVDAETEELSEVFDVPPGWRALTEAD